MVSFIRPEIKYFIRAGELSFLRPVMTQGGKETILPAHVFFRGRKIEAANSKQRAGWKQWNFTVLPQDLREKTVKELRKKGIKKEMSATLTV